MTGNQSQLMNFVSKFLGTARFENDHIARIMGYGDYQLGNVTISRVYYVEGLGHNLFSVGSRDRNLYTISLDDILKTSPIYLSSKALKTKSWLWRHQLSHLNFGTLNKEKLDLLHIVLCCPMRVASINGKSDNDDLGKLDAKADIGIFVGYTLAKKAFRIYNKRSQKIIEIIHVTFDELGPSIASGDQVCGPICADFPAAPIRSKIQIRVMAFNLILREIQEFLGTLAQAKMVEKSTV
nr:hypothetical protein [Tanacetum cinerariifolium]